jgi:starch synthase (maltosyl-transferring)
MQALAKAGFTQSYTYFSWRNLQDELSAYLTELTQTEQAEYFRGNLFVNTPDILPPILQHGGPPAFKLRVALAATCSPLYGVYSGYELCEADAVPGTEEYANSEKYEIRVRDWRAPGHIIDYIARLNEVRRAHPALQQLRGLRFHAADSDHVLFYGRTSADGTDRLWVAVNLDPFEGHEATLTLPLGDLDLPPDGRVEVQELFTGRRQLWRGPTHRIALPRDEPAAIFHVSAPPRLAFQDPCA